VGPGEHAEWRWVNAPLRLADTNRGPGRCLEEEDGPAKEPSGGAVSMLLSILLTSVSALVLSTTLLVVAGHRLRLASPVLSVVLTVLFAELAGQVTAWFWHVSSHYVLAGGVFVAVSVLLVVVGRPMWNPVGQLFFGSTVAAATSYLLLAGWVTVSGALSPLASVASALLWCIEALAFLITASFAFESCDVVCRVRWTRPQPEFDPSYQPKVSLHVPAYAEPPDMLLATIRSLEALDYPDLEIVVIDNNTADEDLWRPVERYCELRRKVRFVHVNPWPGYKSGALNLALRAYTSPDAEIIGVVDADYLVSRNYLKDAVGYFASPDMAFVQTPQDYRGWMSDRYLTSCHDAYRYFFETAMPSRNDRNSIIFGGTMGLIRRAVLDEIGGWDETCITEDAEASLRILKAGYSGFYLHRSYGRGIMPLTFGALKRQMFRWCFGGIQILRKHGRSLMPWDRRPDNHLRIPQRLDYLLGGLQWFGNLVGLVFTAVLGLTAATLIAKGHVPFGPLLGAAVVLPLTMLASGLVRALWALRHRTGISYRRAVLAFVTWLSLSWTVAMACLQGVARTAQPFLRTPKFRGDGDVVEALRATRAESGLAAAAWLTAAALALSGKVSPVLVALFAWQGAVYAASPTMAWLNQRSHLPVRLERLRRAEERRDRFASARPHLVRVGLGTAVASLTTLLLVGTLSASRSPRLDLILTPPSGGPAASGSAGSQAGSGDGSTNTAGSGTTGVNQTGAQNSGRGSQPAGSSVSGATPSGVAATTTTAPLAPAATSTTITTTRPVGSSTTTTRPTASSSTTLPSQATTTTTNPHKP
jgi:cellulose synthase/poly-beta-1,6-N-acetylglucosamine synthase-like glycosyltransferase